QRHSVRLRRVHRSLAPRSVVALIPAACLGAAAIGPTLLAEQPATDCIVGGAIVSGRTPLPGVVVSIVDESNRTVDVAATAVDGTYALKIPGAGQYTLKADFSAFAPATHPLTIDAANCRPRVDVSMTLASRAPSPAGASQRAGVARSTNNAAAAPAPLPARPAGGRGQRPGAQRGQPFQNLSLR